MKLRRFFCLIPLLLSLPLSACNFVDSGEDDSLKIARIETELDDEGNTLVTIHYTDEDKKPLTFTIPKGESGNGIRQIQESQSEDGKSTILTISYTAEGSKDSKVTIPNGVSVLGYRTEVDEKTGETKLYFTFSDGKESDPIVIPQGKEGDSIQSLNASTDEMGNTLIHIVLTSGQEFVFRVPKGEKGDSGNGIVSIDGKQGTGEEEGTYILTFTYSNGDTSSVTLTLPTTSKWYQGNGQPETVNGAKDGDYYFDTKDGIIYLRENGIWVAKITIPTEETKSYTVSFHWNGDEVITRNTQPVTSSTNTYSYTISKGMCFASVGEPVPFATKSGYLFQGWYTTKTPNVTNGAFTDLTPVSGDLDLYTSFVLKD